MEKGKKMMNMILLLTVIVYSLIVFTINPVSFAINQSISTDINGINDSAYPGIKERIQVLKNKYPNWNFKILYTDLDWNDVIRNEYQGHGSSPKNLVQKKANYEGAWICPICGDRPYDNGSWRCASEQAIRYMMDPRNSLNASDIFQFEELTNNGCDINIVRTMTSGTFLAGHEQGIVDAANNNGVNPYYIVARLIQEQGRNGSALTSGATGYYNAFNIGASGNTSSEIIANGLAYAQRKGWTTLEKSIDGGISFVANQYIKQGQNTLYLQKFNVTTYNGPYTHQYQQNIMAAQSEGTTLRNTYINTNSLNSSHTFIIPVYRNMPSAPCNRPGEGQDPNPDVTSDLVRVNVDSSLKIRKDPNDSTAVGWLWKDEIATRLEKATTKINGTYWDKVKKADGTIGYAARETFDYESSYKLYLVPIGDESSGGNDGGSGEKPDEGNDNPQITYILGDCNGDNIIDSGDLLVLKRHLIGSGKVTDEIRLKAMDINKDGTIDSGDLLLLRRHLIGVYTISQ